MSTQTSRFLGLPAVLFFCGCLVLSADTRDTVAKASGEFTLDGKAYKISFVLAKTEENSFDEKKKDVVILLTDHPVPEEKLDMGSLFDLSQSGKLHGIMVAIDDQKEPHRLVILGVAQKSGNQICKFEATKFGTDLVEGRVYLSQTEESFDHKYQFDIQFQTSVKDTIVSMVDEQSGTPLPDGGGEPGKAYLEYDKIIRTGDPKALKKFAATEEMAKQLDDPEAKKMMEVMKMMRATGIKIVKGFVSRDRATLFVEGKDPMSGANTAGTVRMLLIKQEWRVEKESWKTSM